MSEPWWHQVPAYADWWTLRPVDRPVLAPQLFVHHGPLIIDFAHYRRKHE